MMEQMEPGIEVDTPAKEEGKEEKHPQEEELNPDEVAKELEGYLNG